LVTDQRDRSTAEPAEAGHEGGIVGTSTIAVEFHKVLEHSLDVIQRVRTLLVPSQLDRTPDLLIARSLLESVELALQALELARKPSTAQKRKTAKPAQALAEAKLVFSCHFG
jgi:hypothetical protein